MVKDGPDGDAVLLVKAVPGASRTRYTGEWNGRAKIAIAAPPEKGKANGALVEFLANLLKIRRTQVHVILGHGNPQKTIRIERISAAAVAAALKAIRS